MEIIRKMILRKRYADNAICDLYMFSGLFANSNQWINLSSQVPEMFNIYYIELPGHGKNKKDNAVKYESYLKMLANEIENISSNRKIFFIGQSLGGLSILGLTKFIDTSNVEKVLLINVATKQNVKNRDYYLTALSFLFFPCPGSSI